MTHYPTLEDLLLSGRIIDMFWSGMRVHTIVRAEDRRVLNDRVPGEGAFAQLASLVEKKPSIDPDGFVQLTHMFERGLQLQTLRAEQGVIIAELRYLTGGAVRVCTGRGPTVSDALVATRTGSWEVERRGPYTWPPRVDD